MKILLGVTLVLLLELTIASTKANLRGEEEAAAAKVTGVTVKSTNEEKIKESVKPKRDASLSIGGVGSGGGSGSSSLYHGPSHKYLPPAASVVIGYDSHSADGRHHATGYDFGSSLADSYHYRHHGGNGAAGVGSVYHAPAKVETYIVQTEHSGSSSSSHGGGGGSSGIGGHHYQHGQPGYKYATPISGSSYVSSGAGGLSYSNHHHGLHGSGVSSGSGIRTSIGSLAGGHHKLHAVYALPAPTPVHYQPAAQSGYASYSHKLSTGAGAAAATAAHLHGHSYELSGLGLGGSGGGAGSHEHVSHGHEHSAGSASTSAGLGYHYAPISTPVVEHVEETPVHGYFSSGSGGGGGGGGGGSGSNIAHQSLFGSHHSSNSGSSSSSIEASGSAGSFGGTSLIAGYNYAVPTLPFPIVRKPQLLINSYGAPAVYEEHQQPEQHIHSGYGHGQGHSGGGGDDATPVYALGHKGLGHFSYTSSKPQALPSDISAGDGGSGSGSGSSSTAGGVSVGYASSGHASAGYAHGGHGNEISKAPFRPSVFLGAKHETSSGSASTTGDDLYYATPTSQYLPPTSGGYEYQAPSLIYGAPTHASDAATPIFEPESTYLPPAHH